MKRLVFAFSILMVAGCGRGSSGSGDVPSGCEVELKAIVQESSVIDGKATSVLRGRGGEECRDYLSLTPIGGVDFSFVPAGERGLMSISDLILCDEKFDFSSRRKESEGEFAWTWSELHGQFDGLKEGWSESELGEESDMKEAWRLPRERSKGMCEFVISVQSFSDIIEEGIIKIGQ
jgi:hypothetical protein